MKNKWLFSAFSLLLSATSVLSALEAAEEDQNSDVLVEEDDDADLFISLFEEAEDEDSLTEGTDRELDLAVEEGSTPFDFLADDESDQPVLPPAVPSSAPPKKRMPRYPALVEFKAGYFFFASHKMREIYRKGGADLQLCASYTVWKPLQVYGSIEYLWKEGKSLNGHQRTHFRAVPLSLGLKTQFLVSNRVDYYFTLGPRYYFVHITNDSHFVDRHLHGNGWGGFLNTGFLFHISPHFVFDLFGEYAYKRMAFHSSKSNVTGHDIQIGGFTFGGGVGYTF